VLLPFVLAKNGRCILRTDIGPLAIQRGGIVGGEKYLQHGFEVDDIRVELDPHHLDMAGGLGAYLLVAGIIHMPPAVSRLDRDNGAPGLETGFCAPETTAAQDGSFRHAGSFIDWPRLCRRPPTVSKLQAAWRRWD